MYAGPMIYYTLKNTSHWPQWSHHKIHSNAAKINNIAIYLTLVLLHLLYLPLTHTFIILRYLTEVLHLNFPFTLDWGISSSFLSCDWIIINIYVLVNSLDFFFVVCDSWMITIFAIVVSWLGMPSELFSSIMPAFDFFLHWTRSESSIPQLPSSSHQLFPPHWLMSPYLLSSIFYGLWTVDRQ